MATKETPKKYNRQIEKTYRVEFLTEGRASSDRMKKGLTARCAKPNGYTLVSCSAGHKGNVRADISYRVSSGAATPTHIRKMLAAVAASKDVEILSDIEIERIMETT